MKKRYLRIPLNVLAAWLVIALPAFPQSSLIPPLLIEKERIVQTSLTQRASWEPAEVGRHLVKKEIVASGEESRAVLQLSDNRLMRVDANTELMILPSLMEGSPLGLGLQKGEAYFYSREAGPEITIKTPTTDARPHGTQFRVKVDKDGTTTFTMFEGTVDLANGQGKLTLRNNQEGIVEPGKAPRRTARIDAKNTIQWCLYYPGVLHLPELGLTAEDRRDLLKPIAAYGQGDLLGALEAWPAKYHPKSEAARVLRATLLLSVGQVEDARAILIAVPADTMGRRAIEEMIDAVNYIERHNPQQPRSASEWLARSYYEQSQSHKKDALKNALAAARKALAIAPDFGFAAVRCAELEFSFGHTKAAMKELSRGLQLSPRNAQAYCLQGFIYSDENRMAEARASFDTAIQLDSALGNAWLGRGLCSIRSGHSEEGRRDLQTAVVLEPNRSLLHSYFGKASAQAGLMVKAREDLDYAKILDKADPTPWLYSSLLYQENYKPNLAIRELQESIKLNDNRRLYRSDLLLDQDRAVRSANLAKLYQYNGMKDVAVREATRAVESDYTNPSAHLFLANSFDALRDPNRILLRYETPWFNELLLSNLLSPVGGGQLSQFVSQQEYSKLLEADGVGGNFTTQWRDTNTKNGRDGSEFRSTASVYGTEGKVSYGLDAYYRNDPGNRPNSRMEIQEYYGQFKWQPSPDDIFYFLGKWAGQKSGNNAESYDNNPILGEKFDEYQEPGLLLAGWNHRWGPGSNTLLLGGKLNFEQSLSNPNSGQLLIRRRNDGLIANKILTGSEKFTDPSYSITNSDGTKRILHYSPELLQAIQPYLGTGDILSIIMPTINSKSAKFDFNTHRKVDIYSAEIQHIFQSDHNTLLFGGRWQQGRIEVDQTLNSLGKNIGGFPDSTSYPRHVNSEFLSTGLYAYDYWNIMPQLTLIGGVAWDIMDHPENFRNPPISDQQKRDEDLSAKLGFTYTPNSCVTIRGLAAGGMGGLSFDESVRLEPSQLAGFNQAYRTVISESLVGSVEAPLYQIYGLSAEGYLPTHTWWGVSINAIDQKVSRTRGVFTGYYNLPDGGNPSYFADGIVENLNYHEASLGLTLNQLIGDEFSVGASYRLTASELQQRTPALDNAPVANLNDVKDRATLQELSLYADWNSPSGFFAHLEANALAQNLQDDPDHLTVGDATYPRSGDEFIQLNAWLGYRFNRNRSEITTGVFNIGDTDYQLSPLNPYAAIARNRTFFVMCRFGF